MVEAPANGRGFVTYGGDPQAFGRLPWLAAFFLRERRLRPPLPIVVSLGRLRTGWRGRPFCQRRVMGSNRD